MGMRLALQDWWHIVITISKKHARLRGAAKADFDEDADDNDEAERYEVPEAQGLLSFRAHINGGDSEWYDRVGSSHCVFMPVDSGEKISEI